MHSLRHRRLAAAALTLALAGLLATACGDDDDVADAIGTTGTNGGEGAGPAALNAEACDAYAALAAGMVGDPSTMAEPAATLAEALADDLRDAGTSLAEAVAAGPDALGTPEFTAAWAAVGDAVYDGCQATSRLDVTGVDFGFEGLPATVPAGRTAIRFTNGTTSGEMHELLLMRRNEGTTESVEELLALGPDQLMEKLTMAGVAFADSADATSVLLADLAPGAYVAVCMIPVGGGETGDPHAAHGMVAELEVA
jgi:hypothetical protein